MSAELHWQIALNQFCPIPPAGKRKYDNTSKWMTDRAPQVFVDPEEYASMDAIIDTYLKAGEYSVLKYLHKFEIPEHTKIKRITMRRKALNLSRSKKLDEVISLHKSGLRNHEICVKLNCAKEYVKLVLKRYKDKENAKAS